MAIAKVILNGEVQMDVTSDTVEANKLLEGETATKNDGTKVTGTFVAPDPVISALSVTPTESEQIFSGAETNILERFMRSSYDTTNRTITADVDFSYLEYGATYHVEGKINYYPGMGQYNHTVTIDTDWVASENGEIPFTNDNGGSVSKVTLSKTQIIVYFSVSINSRWSISYNVSDRRAFVFTRSVDGYKPVTVGGISSTYIGSAIPLKSSADLTASGSTVTVPVGYYSSKASSSISAGFLGTPTINLISSTGVVQAIAKVASAGYLSVSSNSNTYTMNILSAQTIAPTESVQYISSYRWLTGSQTIEAIASDYVGTAVPMKSTADLYQSYTKIYAPSGYYSSEIFYQVSTTSHLAPTIQFTSSNGLIHVGHNAYDAMIGYKFLTGDATTYTDRTLPTQAAQTITPTESVQYISSYRWLTGSQTIAAIPSSYIIPSGTYSVTENGTYDIGSYASVDVSVAGGGDTAIEDAVIGGIPVAVSIYSNDRISLIRPNACQNINASVFDVPNVSNIGSYAFSNNSYVNTVLTSKLLNVSSHAFRGCTNLENIDLSPVISISEYAFSGTKLSSSLTLSYLVSMSQYAFLDCDSLPFVSLPYYNRPISQATFHHCDVLSEFYAPFATSIQGSAFNQCNSLTKCNIITAWNINSYAFSRCSNLSSIAFGAQKVSVTIGQNAFSGCKKLHDVYICNRLSGSGAIQAYAFSGCSSLSNLYILSPSYVALSTSTAFRDTPIQSSTTGYGSIYVPAALYDSYISGSYWSYFSDRFVSLTSSEVDAVFDSLSEVNLWKHYETDPDRSRSTPLQLVAGEYKSLNKLIGKQAEYKLLLNDNPGGATINYLHSMAIFSQILLQSYTTVTAVVPSLNLDFSLYVDLENNTVSHNFNSGTLYGYTFYLRCL